MQFEKLLKHDHRSALKDLNMVMDSSIQELAKASGINYLGENYTKEVYFKEPPDNYHSNY